MRRSENPVMMESARTPEPVNDFAATMLVITCECMDHAETALQQKLLRTFLTLLLESSQLPRAICFYTQGVRLVILGAAGSGTNCNGVRIGLNC